MIFRQGVRVAEWIGAILGGLAVVLAACFWLLSRGPISLDWMAPLVSATLTRTEPGLVASVDHTHVWLAEGPRLDIQAKGIHLRRADGGAELFLPSVTLSLSPEAALRGEIAPKRIVIEGARLRLVRTADGVFHIGIAGEQPATGDWAEALLQGLAQPPDRRDAFGYLAEVEVRDASLLVEDKKLGATWSAKRLDATLARTADGVLGHLDLTLDRGGTDARIRGDLQYSGTPRHLRLAVSFTGLKPALFATAAPRLGPLAALDLPLGGQVSMTFDPDGRRFTDFSCDLTLGKGLILDPRLAGGELRIRSGTLKAAFDPATKALHLQRFTATLDEPDALKLDLAATIQNFDPLARQPLAFSGHLHVKDLTVPDFPFLWPKQVAFHARHWIMMHLWKGRMTGGDVAFSGTLELNAPGGIAAHVANVGGGFSYTGVSVSYLNMLAPVSQIAGTARFDRKEMILYPTGGVSRDVKLSDATIRLTELDTHHEQAYIDLKLVGPLATILDELNKKPLRYAHALGIDPASVAGTAEGILHFHVPMKVKVAFSDVDYAAHGTLDHVAIGGVLFDRNLTAGHLHLAIDRAGLKVDGTGRLQDKPVTLAWTENFGAVPVRTRYHLSGRFDDAARRKLGIDWLSDQVTGPVGIDLTFAHLRSGLTQSHVALDLGAAAIAVKRLGWAKPPGQPATATFNIEARDGLPTRITGIRVDGAGLDAAGALTLTGGGLDAGIARVDVRHLGVGRTDLTAVATPLSGSGWRIALSGNSLDATRLFEDLEKTTPARSRDPPLLVTADLGRVYLSPDRVASAVHAQLYSDGLHWQTASIDAAPAPGSTLSLRFGTLDGTRQFHLATDNLGGFLHLLDISSKVRGGKLSVTGHAEDVGTGRVLTGSFAGKDYRIIDAPAFARLLSAASLTGAAALVSGRGIPFSRIEGDFVLADGAVQLSNARAYGEAIGINASGRFDYRGDKVDISGTVVPSYLLNSFLGNIPVLGDLLLGGKGQGIFAANFHVAGPINDPGISVNPLSALAPGFLRRLFLFAPGTPETNDARRSAAPAGG